MWSDGRILIPKSSNSIGREYVVGRANPSLANSVRADIAYVCLQPQQSGVMPVDASTVDLYTSTGADKLQACKVFLSNEVPLSLQNALNRAYQLQLKQALVISWPLHPPWLP
jgi:hypothetical protein